MYIDSYLNLIYILCLPFLFCFLLNLYSDNTLLTYGQYVWPNGQVGHCKPYTKEAAQALEKLKTNAARQAAVNAATAKEAPVGKIIAGGALAAGVPAGMAAEYSYYADTRKKAEEERRKREEEKQRKREEVRRRTIDEAKEREAAVAKAMAAK